MARKYVLVDDLDNRESTEDNPVETVAFAYGGKSYTIDLSAKNKTALDKALAKYVDAAAEVVPEIPSRAKTRATRATRGRSAPASAETETAEIRAWAVSRGIMEQGKRGRIPSEIVQQYRQETGRIVPPAQGSAQGSAPASDQEPVSQAS